MKYAPELRFAPEESHLFADLIFGLGALALVAFAGVLAYRAWRRARTSQRASATARFHAHFALVFLVALGVCQLYLYADYRALRAHGITVDGEVLDRRRWSTRNKSQNWYHYACRISYSDGARREIVEEETNATAYWELSAGTYVPLVHVPGDPRRVQLGRADEIGLVFSRVSISVAMFSLLGVAYLIGALARRSSSKEERA